MIYLLNEACVQKLRNLLTDGPPLLLVGTEKPLLDRMSIRPDLQRVLGDLPWNSRNVRGLPSKDIFIGAEEVDERTFLFGGQRGVEPQLLVPRPLGVEWDFLDILLGLKRPSFAIGVWRFLKDVGPDEGELLRCDDRQVQLATVYLALVGVLVCRPHGDDYAGPNIFSLR
jgi:hypothetical protein